MSAAGGLPPRGQPEPPQWTDLPGEPLGPETPSGVHRAVKSDLNLYTLGLGAFSLLVGLAALWVGQRIFVSEARAAGKEAADAGVAALKVEVIVLQEQFKLSQQEQTRLAGQVDRQGKMLDAIADKVRVPESARPPPVPDAQKSDAGVPKRAK